MRRRQLPALFSLAGLFAAGCASPERARLLAPGTLAPDPERATVAFAPSTRILEGVDPPEPTQSWHVGDQALYGVFFDDGEHQRTWFVRAEVLTPVLDPATTVILTPPEGVSLKEAAGGNSIFLARPADVKSTDSTTRFKARVWNHAATLEDKHGHQHIVLVYSSSIFFRLHVYDEHGDEVAISHTLAPESFLRDGLYAQCQVLLKVFEQGTQGVVNLAALSDRDMKSYVAGYFSLYAVGQTLWRTPEIDAIFEKIVPKPSLLSIVLNAGVRVSVALGNDAPTPELRPLPGLAGGRPAYRLPLEVKINNEPAVQCDLIVAPPHPPLHVGGGIVGVEGSPVHKPNQRFVIRLLAARRGTLPVER